MLSDAFATLADSLSVPRMSSYCSSFVVSPCSGSALPEAVRSTPCSLLGAILCCLCTLANAVSPRSACAQYDPAPEVEPPGVAQMSPSLRGPSVDSSERGPWVPSVATMARDALTLGMAPTRLARGDGWKIVGASALLAGLVAEVDRETSVYLSDDVGFGNGAPYTSPLAGPGRLYDRIGPDRVLLGTAGVLAATGVVAQNRKLTRTSVRIGEALVYTNLLTDLFKGFISRSRPNPGVDAHQADIGRFSMTHSKLSMPSGHTARAFALASVLSHSFDRWYVQIPSFALATSVGLQRIESGNHWLSDVVVGGALGYFVGKVVTDGGYQHDGVSYHPVLSPRRVGLTVNF